MKEFSSQPELTAHWEGFKAKAYKDIANVWTIGFGTTRINGIPVKDGMTCTMLEAFDMLQADLDKNEDRLDKLLSPAVYPSHMIDAISDYAYNCGMAAFPTLLAKLKRADVIGASLEFLDGIYVNKKPVMGLLLRRISEYNTFINNEYKAFEVNDKISKKIIDLVVSKNIKNQDSLNLIKRLKT